MGKMFLVVSALLVPLTIYLACFSGPGFDPESLKNQRVLITGASSGIGEHLAYQYAKLGARLVITARREGLLQNVSRTCMGLGAQEVHLVAADMANPADISRVIKAVEKRLGGLDHLILNHAILMDMWWNGSDQNLTTLDWVMRVNFMSHVHLASKALPMLIASQGRIGVVSSGFGQLATIRTSAYSASKFALNGFFSSLRQELRHNDTGVSVTFVVLGPVSTETLLEAIKSEDVPKGTFVTPDEAAVAILESVAQRHYNVRVHWSMKLLLFMNDLFPCFSEYHYSSFVLNQKKTSISRFLRFSVWIMCLE